MKRLALFVAMLAGWGLAGTNVSADEPAQAFLEALRDNGYHDVAIEYLESLKSSSLVSAEFKQALPFELAQTIIGSTANMRDVAGIETRLDQAQQLLTDYASGNQPLEVSAKTLHYQGNLLYRRSKIYVTQASSDRLTAGEKAELLLKARSNLESSLKTYLEAKSQIRRLIDPNSPDVVRIDPEDPSTTAVRDQFRATYTRVRANIPKVMEQLADTQDSGSAEQQTLLAQARDEYKNVWDAYPRFMAGLNSCVYSARCSHKLGDHKASLEMLSEIFSLGDNAVFKNIKLEAYVLATECWAKIKPYPYNEVVIRLEPAVQVLNKVEIKQPDWLRIQMELAIAKWAKAAEIKAKDGPTSNRQGKEMERAAGKILRNVARVPSKYRDQAMQLLSEWNVNLVEPTLPSAKPLASFEDARERGRDLVTEIEATVSEASLVKRQLAAKQGLDKSQLTEQYDEKMSTIDELSKQALEAFNLALEFANAETVRADINNVRYLQSYCYFANRKYFEAALISEFLLAKYPNVDGTKQAMTLMIQSYSIMMDQAEGDDKAYEQGRLVKACDTVIGRWPGSNEAGVAGSTMTRLSLNLNDFVQAQTYFDAIPRNASYRNSIGNRLGQRMWFAYKASRRVPDAQLESLKPQLRKTIEFLSNGVDDVLLDEVDYDVALSALFLVDAHLYDGNVDKALERLEGGAKARVAPLDLVKQQHPAITNTASASVYRRETYRTAIKTYLAALEGSDDQQKWIDRAGGIIDAMRAEMQSSQDPKDRARITQIYQLIAKELKEEFQAIDDVGKKQKFADSLSSFLGAITESADDSRVILWAGSTMLGVAESLSESGLTQDAQPLFVKAVAALGKAEQIGFRGEAEEQAMLTELNRQRALAQRGSGEFEQSIQQFVKILEASPNSLSIQLDAAETLQRWGQVTKSSKQYVRATKGTQSFKDPKTKRTKNLIWGWEKIALATRSNSKFRSTFYNALYHVAECRLEYGLITEDKKAVESASREVEKERKRDPSFNGSAEWKAKFNSLDKRIKQALK
ncbi:MAG: tetratricopeptide (TPR) repeat protein [Mariniblastus sp.]